MLEEIMRRGTRSLGADVPSEREINRLAARTEEELWMFEKMDEERRQRENYSSRLMEENEVPEWAYSAPDSSHDRPRGFDIDLANLAGKRARKDVVYGDNLTELQWLKAIQNASPSLPSHRTREGDSNADGSVAFCPEMALVGLDSGLTWAPYKKKRSSLRFTSFSARIRAPTGWL